MLFLCRYFSNVAQSQYSKYIQRDLISITAFFAAKLKADFKLGICFSLHSSRSFSSLFAFPISPNSIWHSLHARAFYMRRRILSHRFYIRFISLALRLEAVSKVPLPCVRPPLWVIVSRAKARPSVAFHRTLLPKHIG